MKKVNLIKGILLILLSVVLIGTTGVYAADLDGDIDELQNLTPTNTASNENVRNNNANVNKSNSNVSNSNANVNKTNSSVYNNTNNTSLPKTGIEDSLPTMVLVVIFAVSAVYAYKKIKDYNNI